MGGGRWSTDVYKERERTRKATGESAFAYSDTVKKSGTLKVHPTLDPFGVTVRESRDSAEHPESNAIAVMFDVTGSMRTIPVQLQQYLPQLLGLLLYKNYIPHPQILFGAIGDAVSDQVPLQVGQFESDNRMDEHLQNLVLEGGGGPYGMESYELALYFVARHTAMDCWEKRKDKGYLFMIGDEMAYPHVETKAVNQVIDGGLQAKITLSQIIEEVRERYHLFFVIPAGASGGHNTNVYEFWKKALGEQHVLTLEEPKNIAETIALTIGMNEGTIGLDEGLEDLREMGTDEDTLKTVTKALAVRPNTSGITKASGSLAGLDDDDDGDSGNRRL